MMTTLPTDHGRGRSWFTEHGRLRTGALAVFLIPTSLLISWAGDFIGWARHGWQPTVELLVYGLLFGVYVAVGALIALLVLRVFGRKGGLLRILLPSYVISLCGYIVLRWTGDQWLMPAFGAAPNYPRGTSFFSFALDNLTYGTVPFLLGTLLYLIETQFIGLSQRLRLAHERRVAELDMLRARVAPHFLFNTLNNLYALSLRPGADVSAPLHEMAELMRHITKRDGRTLPLADEWALVQRYCTLQALRYERPLNLHLDADERALGQPMEALVLLPLVENAFKHGDPCHAEVPLLVVVRIADDHLSVRCENAVGKPTEADGPSTGLRDLQRLLHLLYDGKARATFASRRDRFAAELSLPLVHA